MLKYFINFLYKRRLLCTLLLKNSLQKALYWGGGVFCIVLSLFLTSCDNFLKAADIKDEIEKVIEYNNAQLVNVLIRSEERIGSFLLEGEKEFKINHTVAEVQFTANNKVCIFEGLEAVSKTDTSISRNDCVEIKKISGNKDTGVYTYTIKVTQKQNDILIRPVYQLRPSVVSISPLYTNDPTEPIVITFDVPVEDKDSKKETPVFDFNNISIKYGNIDITNKFNQPVLNEDKTVLTINPDSTKFNEFLSDNYNVTYVNINISLDPRTLFDVNGNYLYFAEDNSLNFTVHYCTDFETTPPLEIGFVVYKNWDSTTDSGESEDELSLTYEEILEDYEHYENYEYDELIEEEKYAAHIIGEYVYISGRYNDEDSDIKTIEVEEYFDEDLNPNCYEEYTTPITKKYTKESDEVILWNKYYNGDIAFCIKKKLLSPDGLIRLRTTVKDTYGNPADTQEVCVIKSTSIEFYNNLYLINVPTLKFCHTDDPQSFDMAKYEAELRDIKFIYYSPFYDNRGEKVDEELMDENCYFSPMYGYRILNPDKVYKTIKCQYYNDNNELVEKSMNCDAYTEPKYFNAYKFHCIIPESDVADLNNLKLKILIEDDFGNTYYKDYCFPGRTVLARDEKDSTQRHIYKVSETDDDEATGLIVFKNGNNWLAQFYGNDIDLNITYIPDGTEFYLVSSSDDSLTAPLNEKFIAGSKALGTHAIEYDRISYELKENQKILIDIKIKDSSLNYFDSIFAKIGDEDDGLDQYKSYYLTKGEKSIKILKRTSDLFYDPQKVILYGIKNGVCSISDEIHIQKFTDPKYDNISPLIEWSGMHFRFPEYFYFNPEDRQSGVSRISINGITFDYPAISDNEHHYSYIVNYNNHGISLQPVEIGNNLWNSNCDGVILLNLYDVIDYSLGFPCINLEIKVYDKANNVYTEKVNEKIEKGTPVKLSNPSSNTWSLNTSNFNVSRFINQNWEFYMYREGGSKTIAALSNYFVRFYDEYSIPTYYYKTSSVHNKINDSLALTGSQTQMRVSSNDPVLVQTIVTPRSYSVCKDWTKEEWLFYKKIIGEEVFYLSSSNTRAIYNIPLDQIKQDECYVVIAHFADGSSIMSEVMVKE